MQGRCRVAAAAREVEMSESRKRVLLQIAGAAVLLSALLCAAPAGAQCTATWMSTSGGPWTDPANWEDFILPGPGDVVCINSPVNVTLNQNWEIGGLIIDSGISTPAELWIYDVGGALVTLTVNNDPVIVGPAGILILTNAAVVANGASALNNTGDIFLADGTLSLPVFNDGFIEWADICAINGPLTTGLNSNIEGGDDLLEAELTVAASFENNGFIIFPGGANTSLFVLGTLTNSANGKILGYLAPSKSAAPHEAAVISAEIVNYGSIQSENVPLIFDRDGVNHSNMPGGVIEVIGGDMDFYLGGTRGGTAPRASSFTNGGIIIIGASKSPAQTETLTITGGVFSPANGELQNSGILSLINTSISGGTLTNNSNRVEMTGCTIQSATAVVNNNAMSCKGLNTVYGSLGNTNGATLAVAGTAATGPADLVINTGFANYGIITLDSPGPTPVQAALTVSGGAFNNRAGGELWVTGGLLGTGMAHQFAGQLVNEGEITVVSSDLEIAGGSYDHSNLDGATIELQAGSLNLNLDDAKGGAAPRASSFTNGGIIIIGSSWTTTANAKIGSTSARATSFTNGGIIIIGSSASMIHTGPDFTNGVSGELQGDGTLDVSAAASASNQGTIKPGASPGIFTVIGDLPYTSTANLEMEVGGYVAGDDHDQVVYIGNVGIDGTLNVTLINSFVPVEGDEFVILTYTGWWGAFDQTVLPALPDGLGWAVTASSGQILLQVVCTDGPQLRTIMSASREVMSVGQQVEFDVTVRNLSDAMATNVVLVNTLPGGMTFVAGASSPLCADVGGGLVQCFLFGMNPWESETVTITAQAWVAEQAINSADVSADQCEVLPADNSAFVEVQVSASAPCDADGSGILDDFDPAAAAAYIFGATVSGNPDCNQDGIIDATDLARIINELDQLGKGVRVQAESIAENN